MVSSVLYFYSSSPIYHTVAYSINSKAYLVAKGNVLNDNTMRTLKPLLIVATLFFYPMVSRLTRKSMMIGKQTSLPRGNPLRLLRV